MDLKGNFNLTGEMVDFLMKDVIPFNLYYSKKDKYAYCTRCHSQFHPNALGKTKPNTMAVCPICKETVRLRPRMYSDGYRYMTAIIPQNVEGNLLLRYFDVVAKDTPTGHFVDYREVMRECHYKPDEFDCVDRPINKDWMDCHIRQYSNSWNKLIGDMIIHVNFNTYGYFIKSSGTKIMANGISEIVKGTAFKNLYFDTFVERCSFIKDDWIAYQYFLRNVVNKDVVLTNEYLCKVGFWNIFAAWKGYGNTSVYINCKKKSLIDQLGLIKEFYRKLLNKGNPSVDDLKKYQFATKNNVKEADIDDVYTIFKSFIYEYQFNELMKLVGERNSYHKIATYVSKHDSMMYLDYLRMCRKLEYNFDKRLLFPNDLKAAHDNCAYLITMNEMQKRNALIDNNHSLRSKIDGFMYNGYALVLPKELMEISLEGQTLRHCVGTYVDRVKEGLTTICFVRPVNDLTTPYYTMEIKGNKIIQCRGFANSAIPTSVMVFLKKFAKEMDLEMRDIPVSDEVNGYYRQLA